jgi:hypothetical protein
LNEDIPASALLLLICYEFFGCHVASLLWDIGPARVTLGLVNEQRVEHSFNPVTSQTYFA